MLCQLQKPYLFCLRIFVAEGMCAERPVFAKVPIVPTEPIFFLHTILSLE